MMVCTLSTSDRTHDSLKEDQWDHLPVEEYDMLVGWIKISGKGPFCFFGQ